jgi:uncharacterized damage-inducible protein DinB
VNALQAELSTFPAFLAQALDAVGDPGARQRPTPERWSLCEVLWHLADMERDYFARALQSGSKDGLHAPAARTGSALDPFLALERFQSARRENLQRAENAAIWQAMAEHDARHRRQILLANS